MFQNFVFCLLFITTFSCFGLIDFESQVLPILDERCVECHKAPYNLNGKLKEPKAGLRLDGAAFIMFGGDNGPIVVADYPSQSSLYQRVILPINDSEHMPPKGEPLSKNQKEIFRKWIAQGLDFGKWVGNIDGVDGLALKKSKKASNYIPSHIEFYKQLSVGIDRIPISRLNKIGEETNLMIRPIGIESPLIEVRVVTDPGMVGDNEVEALLPFAHHIVKLDLRNSRISEDSLSRIGSFKKLVQLNLRGTKIGNEGLNKLGGLKLLESLNICETEVSDEGLDGLKEIVSLRKVYLWGSQASDFAQDELINQLSGK